jgi:hypothetical protein
VQKILKIKEYLLRRAIKDNLFLSYENCKSWKFNLLKFNLLSIYNSVAVVIPFAGLHRSCWLYIRKINLKIMHNLHLANDVVKV